MEQTFLDLLAKYGIGGAVAYYAISYLVPKMFKARAEIATHNLQTTETNARIDMVETLNARVAKMEEEQDRLRKDLDEERNKRVEAEDMVDSLTRQLHRAEDDREHLTQRVKLLSARVDAMAAQIRNLGHEPV